MEFVGPIAAESTKSSCAIFVRQISYIKNLERNYGRLNENATALYSKKEDIEREINRDQIGRIPTSECQCWLKKVDEIHDQLTAIVEEYSKGDMRCLRRWCLNVPSSWKLGQRIVVTTNAILDLIEKSDFKGGAVVDGLPQIVETKPVVAIEDGTSTERTLNKILECVKNLRTQKIGIWGMGGVGKTTVMKSLNNLPEITEMFHIVIWVTVSKDYITRKLQTEIAERLSLKISNERSDERVASRLFQHLATMKFLLLMDDLWDIVDLDDIGIPCPNQNNGCKVVLTTRNREVCSKMGTDEEIMVEPLSKNEAWNLFRERVGEVVDSPSIQRLAEDVVRECDGLPLAIIVIGASLRKEANTHIWENAVQVLSSPDGQELSSPDTSDIYDIESRVFKRLQFSFDRLKNDNVQKCFLYAALYPEDHSINIFELIEYWRAEGLVKRGSTLKDVRNKGHVVLKDLINASLLLQSSQNYVTMHDVIRDLALRITSPKGSSGCRFFVRANKMLEKVPENEEWEHVDRMSLMQNKLSNLLERPNCPALSTLFLQENEMLRTIPESFFEHMHALRVLDLSKTGIESLPHSICYLVNLRGLFLRKCRYLKTLPPEIESLERLEVLDAQGAQINTLPAEIKQLTRLKVLQVEFSMERDENGKDVMISGGIISRLSHLEQLRIDLGFMDHHQIFGQCGDKWDKWDKCAEAVTKDVSDLKELMILEFFFPKVEYLECFLQESHPWKKGMLMSFNFIVGQCELRSIDGHWFAFFPGAERIDRMLTFCGCESIPIAIVEVLRHANSFQLLGHRSIHSLSEFGMQNMSRLRRCNIRECDAMEIVIEGHRPVEVALPILEELVISYMPNLRSIWEGSFLPGSLNCLTYLHLTSCPKLKNIFSRQIIQQLSNLEYLTVDDCSALEEVISEDAVEVESERVLPKLKYLMLYSLPGLVRIWNGHLLNCSSLEEIWVNGCANLKRLPISINTAPNLRRINCRREWWNELEWDDNAIKLQLEPFLARP